MTLINLFCLFWEKSISNKINVVYSKHWNFASGDLIGDVKVMRPEITEVAPEMTKESLLSPCLTIIMDV